MPFTDLYDEDPGHGDPVRVSCTLISRLPLSLRVSVDTASGRKRHVFIPLSEVLDEDFSRSASGDWDDQVGTVAGWVEISYWLAEQEDLL